MRFTSGWIISVCLACFQSNFLVTLLYADAPPAVPREFRGVWVATVDNIDWPSKRGLPVADQKRELERIFDVALDLKLNAVVFQIRPMCDALYDSTLEPWSEYLTGKLGQKPKPYYDPLALAIELAHARGLELHAWFNPYRARHPSAKSATPADHLVKKRPDLAKAYGKHYWLNPTHKEVQTHSLAVMLDVVKRYDVDGIHIDDYFYPYKEKDADGKVIPFPDDDTWAAYQSSGGTRSRDDWRRDAVNGFVERMYMEVKAAKPWVKVGISPFGIWRPGHPAGIQGFDQYAELYADAKLWFNKGWCDYFTPQLYWPIKQEKQSYPKLLAWWAGENMQARHLWPGNIPSRVTGQEKGWPAEEIADQVRATRTLKGASGNVHFSMKPLLRNTGGVADALQRVYEEPALVPAMPWLNAKKPAKPTAVWQDGLLAPRASGTDVIRRFVVRAQFGTRWEVRIFAMGGETTMLSFASRPSRVVVTAIDRFGNESEAVVPR